MIDIRTEQLLPTKEIPGYLESRGFGKRVSMRVVNRWIREECNGARLEVVRIDQVVLTSLEALQRWVERQSGGVAPGSTPAAVGHSGKSQDLPAMTPEHEASMQFLIESRVVPTGLDLIVRSLAGHPESSLAYAAGVLFRAGMRSAADARAAGLEGLQATTGMGARSRAVVRDLWRALGDQASGG